MVHLTRKAERDMLYVKERGDCILLWDRILKINNTAGTLRWVCMKLSRDETLYLSYIVGMEYMYILFKLKAFEQGCVVTAQKYLHGHCLCTIDTVGTNEDEVFSVICAFIRFGYGGLK